MLYFIVNEKSRSGKGAKIWQEIMTVLQAKNITYKAWITEYAGHSFSLAGNICEMEDPDICLIVVGGDGTANEVINGMTHFEKVRFGVIPTGSGNDLARGLGIKGSPVETLHVILNCIQKEGEARTLDLGQVTWNGGEKPRLFAISAGTGLDALVCKKALKSKVKDFLNKLHLGKLTYLFLTVESLFSMKTSDAAVHFDAKGQKNLRKVIYIAAMNFPAEGGGVPMAPAADAADGKLSMCCVHGIPKWKTLFLLPMLVLGKHTGIRGFEIVDGTVCSVRLKTPMVLHADGEYCGDVTEIQFSCLPGKLRLLQ